MLQKTKTNKKDEKTSGMILSDRERDSTGLDSFRSDVKFLQEQVNKQNQLIEEFRRDIKESDLDKKRKEQAMELEKAKFELEKALGETERVRAHYDEIKYQPYAPQYNFKEELAHYQTMQLKMMELVSSMGNIQLPSSRLHAESQHYLESSNRNKSAEDASQNVPSLQKQASQKETIVQEKIRETPRNLHSQRSNLSEDLQRKKSSLTKKISTKFDTEGSQEKIMRKESKIKNIKEKTENIKEVSEKREFSEAGNEEGEEEGNEEIQNEGESQETSVHSSKKNKPSRLSDDELENTPPLSKATLPSDQELANKKTNKVDAVIEVKPTKEEKKPKEPVKIKLDPPLPKQVARKLHKLQPNSELVVINITGANYLPNGSHFSKIYVFLADIKTNYIEQVGWSKTSHPTADLLNPVYNLTFMPILKTTSVILIYFLELSSESAEGYSQLVGFSIIKPWKGNPEDLNLDSGNLRFPIYNPQYSEFFPKDLIKMEKEGDLKKILSADIKIMIAVMPSNKTPDEYSRQLVEARQKLDYDDEYLPRLEGEPELCKIADDREKVSMKSLVENASMFKRQISEVSALKSKHFDTGEALFDEIDKMVTIANCATFADTLEFYQVKNTKKYSFCIDCVFNFLTPTLLAIVVLPVWRDEGADLEKAETFWDFKRESAFKALRFESDALFDLSDQDELEKLSSIVAVIYSVDYKDSDDITATQAGFVILPARMPSNSFMHGTFQLPVLLDKIEKSTIELISKSNPWSLIDAVTKPFNEEINFTIMKANGSLIVRAYPEELKELYMDECNVVMINSMMMHEDASSEIMFNASNFNAAEESDPKYETLLPEDFLAQTMIEKVSKLFSNQMNGITEESSKSEKNEDSEGGNEEGEDEDKNSENTPASAAKPQKPKYFKRMSKVVREN